MKVILLDYVYKHGVAGEVIDVADGYARNFLIPKKLAVKATPGELKRATKLREQAAVKRAALENTLNELSYIIDGTELIFGRRAASTGKLFGSVTTQEIADALMEKTGVDINRRRISQQSLREIGTHDVPVRLGTEISPVLKITIVREEEMAEFLEKRAAAEAAAEAGETEATEDQSESEDVGSDDSPVPTEDSEEMPTEILPASKVREMVEKLQTEDADDAGEANTDSESEEESD
jgi:large subunit ribosomal protein L9